MFSFDSFGTWPLRQTVIRVVLAVSLWGAPFLAAGGEPLCDWLDGLGAAAQARARGAAEASVHARRALAARPGGEAAVRARLELGLSLGAHGASREKVVALREAAAAAPPMARGALFAALGEALAEAGDPVGAIPAFRSAAAEGGGAVAERARRGLAMALQAAGAPAEALAVWRPLVRDRQAESLDPETRVAFARALRATGDRKRAARILRSLWSSRPELDEAEAAGATLARWRDEGDPVPPFTAAERLARVYRLVAMGKPEEARSELDAADRALPPPSPGLRSLAAATILLARDREEEAVAEVAPYEHAPDAGIRRGVKLVQARAAARQRRIGEAVAAWRAVAASRAPVPGLAPQAQRSLRDDAEFLAAWLWFDAGELRRAAVELDRYAAARPGSRRANDARWFAAWARIRAGATAEADAALRRIGAATASSQAAYWRARIATDPDRRDALLREVAAADAGGYYGLLACARLARADPACEPLALAPGPPLPELERLSDAPRLRHAAALASAGLRDEALEELATVAGSPGGRHAAPHAAELAAFLGDARLPFRLARDKLGLSRLTLPWSFPEAWPSLVEPAARSARVDPALLRAVMRRESGFRPGVRSAAGAVGLLQIIPGTSARLTALLGLPEPFGDRMDEPSVNVPLGAAYLSLLLERFEEPLVAVAAYNAGPNAVLRWNGVRGGMPLDAWIESIPFRETRDYVRAVARNWSWSRRVAGEPPPSIDPDRPIPAPASGVAF